MVLLHFTYIIFFALFGFSLPRWNTLTRTHILRFVSSIRGKWHLLSRFLCALKIIRHKKTNNWIGTKKQKIRKLFPAFPLLKVKGKNEILTPHKKRFLSIWILFDFFALFCWFFFCFICLSATFMVEKPVCMCANQCELRMSDFNGKNCETENWRQLLWQICKDNTVIVHRYTPASIIPAYPTTSTMFFMAMLFSFFRCLFALSLSLHLYQHFYNFVFFSLFTRRVETLSVDGRW